MRNYPEEYSPFLVRRMLMILASEHMLFASMFLERRLQGP